MHIDSSSVYLGSHHSYNTYLHWSIQISIYEISKICTNKNPFHFLLVWYNFVSPLLGLKAKDLISLKPLFFSFLILNKCHDTNFGVSNPKQRKLGQIRESCCIAQPLLCLILSQQWRLPVHKCRCKGEDCSSLELGAYNRPQCTMCFYFVL